MVSREDWQEFRKWNADGVLSGIVGDHIVSGSILVDE